LISVINSIRFTDYRRGCIKPAHKPQQEGEVSDNVSVISGFFRPRTSSRPRHGALHRLALMLGAWRTRRILAEMDPRLLKDIGVSRAEAQAEAGRAPWVIEFRG
jgi:uncharacterized protein YjiS (DUF1127 family)